MGPILLKAVSPAGTYLAADSKISEDVEGAETSTKNKNKKTHSLHPDASDSFHPWDFDESEMDLSSEAGIVSHEDEEGTFMQLEERDGLLPLSMENLFECVPDCLLDQEVPSRCSPSSQTMIQSSFAPFISSLDGPKIKCPNKIQPTPYAIASIADQKNQLEAASHTLRKSMQRSQTSRRRLCSILRRMKGYRRTSNFVKIIHTVEFSTHHVDSFCKEAMTPSSPCMPNYCKS